MGRAVLSRALLQFAVEQGLNMSVGNFAKLQNAIIIISKNTKIKEVKNAKK